MHTPKLLTLYTDTVGEELREMEIKEENTDNYFSEKFSLKDN